jgi:hypothetical protein
MQPDEARAAPNRFAAVNSSVAPSDDPARSRSAVHSIVAIARDAHCGRAIRLSNFSGGIDGPASLGVHRIEPLGHIDERLISHSANRSQGVIFAHPLFRRQIAEHIRLLAIWTTHAI